MPIFGHFAEINILFLNRVQKVKKSQISSQISSLHFYFTGRCCVSFCFQTFCEIRNAKWRALLRSGLCKMRLEWRTSLYERVKVYVVRYQVACLSQNVFEIFNRTALHPKLFFKFTASLLLAATREVEIDSQYRQNEIRFVQISIQFRKQSMEDSGNLANHHFNRAV